MKLIRTKNPRLELEIKRLYLPYTLKCICSECGYDIEWDFEQNELSYPDVYKPFDEMVYCGACNHQFNVKLKIDVSLTIEDNFPDYKNLDEMEKRSFADTTGSLSHIHGDVNMLTKYGVSAIIVAVYHGMVQVVEQLLGKDVNVNVKDLDGKLPLQIAKDRGRIDILEMLNRYDNDKFYSIFPKLEAFKIYQSTMDMQGFDSAEEYIEHCLQYTISDVDKDNFLKLTDALVYHYANFIIEEE